MRYEIGIEENGQHRQLTRKQNKTAVTPPPPIKTTLQGWKRAEKTDNGRSIIFHSRYKLQCICDRNGGSAKLI